MRTITKTMKKVLMAQAKEANVQGMTKIAQQISDQLDVTPTRDKESEYVYEQDDLQQDVEHNLWSAAVRIQDFYGKTVDAKDLHDMIESFAGEFIDNCRKKSGKIVGAYETSVPGQRDIVVEDE